MFFSNGVHKESHSSWGGLVDGIYAIGITLMILDAPGFWTETRELRKQGLIDMGQEHWLTADHLVLLVMSALVCLDLWGLTSIFYRSPGKGCRNTTLLICTSMLIGLGINVAFQTVFDLRIENLAKGTGTASTVQGEIILSVLIGTGYVIIRSLLSTAQKAIKPSIEEDTQYVRKLRSACKHCTRIAIIVFSGAAAYWATGISIVGTLMIGVAIMASWMSEEITWIEDRIEKMRLKN